MNAMTAQRLACSIAIASLVLAARVSLVGASDADVIRTISAARQRYAAAAYEDALDVLATAKPDAAASDLRAEIERYRGLCLYALGRRAEAEEAFARAIRANPTWSPDALHLSPTMREAFRRVRTRLLPVIARERYEDGKAMLDRQAWAPAIDRLNGANELLADPDMSVADDSAGTIADLRLLVQGFLDLARRSQSTADSTAKGSGSPAPLSSAGLGAVAPVPSRTEPGAGLTPPVAIAQPLPPVPRALASAVDGRAGNLALLIDASGRVTNAVVITSINPIYDAMVLEAVRGQWRYRPATRDGRPVPFRTTLTVRVQAR